MSRAEDIFQKLIYFGEEAIDDYIVNSQTEELFLDFKRADSTGKNGLALHKDDRRNLAKAISGFGNSEGGVLIWGVECSRSSEVGDVAQAKVKVQNVHRFLSWLENAISGCTIPSHNRVRNHIVSVDENGDGFVATYIPKSEIAPLMTTVGNTFYIRSGSNNVPAPYSVLAGEYNKVRFLNYNQMDSIPGLEGQLNLITRPELRVPPRSIVRFTNVEIILSPYIESDFLLDGVIGADGTAPRNFRIYIPKNRLRSFVARTMREDADPTLLLNEFFSEFLSGELE